jgi:hypothetical protein
VITISNQIGTYHFLFPGNFCGVVHLYNNHIKLLIKPHDWPHWENNISLFHQSQLNKMIMCSCYQNIPNKYPLTAHLVPQTQHSLISAARVLRLQSPNYYCWCMVCGCRCCRKPTLGAGTKVAACGGSRVVKARAWCLKSTSERWEETLKWFGADRRKMIQMPQVGQTEWYGVFLTSPPWGLHHHQSKPAEDSLGVNSAA